MLRQNRNIGFSYCWIQVLFHYQYTVYHLDLSIIIPLLRKLEVICPPCRGNSHGWVIHCITFHNKNRVCTRWVLQFSLGLLMVSRIGYRVCGWFPCRHTLIAIDFPWIIQISGPPQGPANFHIQEIEFVVCHDFNPVLIHRRGEVHIMRPYFRSEM